MPLDGRGVVVDRARAEDVPAVVALLRDDVLGAGREGPAEELEPYLSAFAALDADPQQLLVVARDEAGAVVATLQLTFIRGLSRGGATRMQVEAVRVAAPLRGSGLGAALLGWAAEHGRRRGAVLAQLTTDLRRADAHRFYERLGWRYTHAGLKLDLTEP
ncbi:GNAT family N-acetyltransferase [Phycicoccus sp. MQZ13P-5]|uniref:GNAT family N-acetyltransferase n=1 Tax=Phycicoccus sonneratiae TaxID=2807628 RepID=A0ABS2CQS3_9MICO|nr:GNAT family N-acetyltransferase [Phycicoccus sonneraticus]